MTNSSIVLAAAALLLSPVTSAIGTSAIGTSAIGTSAIGTSAIGTSAIGTSAIGTSAIGISATLAAAVCAVYCDVRDPSQSRQDSFPVPEQTVNGRRIALHVSDVDGMAWGSIDGGGVGDSVWLDRTWDDGSSWDG